MLRQSYINHVAIVLDASTSMRGIERAAAQVTDLHIQHLAARSQEVDQETRATVYQFGPKTECIFYDKDVLRLPKIADTYKANGPSTALIDATLKAVDDLSKTATLYGDHAFLVYVITDGQENSSTNHAGTLQRRMEDLPDNWTLAVFVPNQHGVFEAKKFGFAPGNIQVWDTSPQGMQEVGRIIQTSTDAYMQARSQGIRSTRGLFQLDTQNLSKQAVDQTLTTVPTSWYTSFMVTEAAEIRDAVERRTLQPYQKGNAFYQLTKSETIQANKAILIRDHRTGILYSGAQARTLLGLPNHDIKVFAAEHPDYDIFVQSTSYNRKLVPGTTVIVLK